MTVPAQLSSFSRHAIVRLIISFHLTHHVVVLQADVHDEPLQIFSLVEQNGVGVRDALLYEAWATVAEKKHQFRLAQEVYLMGIRR